MLDGVAANLSATGRPGASGRETGDAVRRAKQTQQEDGQQGTHTVQSTRLQAFARRVAYPSFDAMDMKSTVPVQLLLIHPLQADYPLGWGQLHIEAGHEDDEMDR